MKEFKARAPGGKIKVRGLFKTSLFAYSVGIAQLHSLFDQDTIIEGMLYHKYELVLVA